jgi:aminopeptidase N
MLRRRMGDERFYSLLADLTKRYDHKKLSTQEFRDAASALMPPKSPDPKLEGFFEQWVFGSGIPGLKLSYSVKGKAPALRVVGTIEQSDVDEDFSTLVPVEIQISRGKTITHWVQTSSTPASFTVAVSAPPAKVLLDPKRSILRR